MKSKPKLLVLLSRIPYPLDKGDKLRAFHQIKDLNASYDRYSVLFEYACNRPKNNQKIRGNLR